jgi:putative membrane protein
MLALYARAAFVRPGWPPGRTTSFVGGSVLLLAGLAPPLMSWAHADLRGHMVQHLLLGMFAPLLLCLGAPVSLLLASVSRSLARLLVSLLHHPFLRALTHPLTALLLHVGGLVVLYATPLYVLSMSRPWLHALVHWHFIAAGYLFCWTIAGTDPAPARPTLRYRGVVLVAAIAAHDTLAKLMYANGWPRGTSAPLDQVRAAAQWMYYGGDLAEMALLAALLAIWYRRAGPPSRPFTTERRPVRILRRLANP